MGPKYTRYNNATMRRKKGKIVWREAGDIELRIKRLVKNLKLDWVDLKQIYCMRSENAKTWATARIWGLGRIWQLALRISPSYVIEVISEKFDQLPTLEKDKVLLHELTHIPRNFSGSLVPHIRRGKRSFKRKVDTLIFRYLNQIK